MEHQSAASLRQAFLDYFVKHGHTRVKSSPLIPAGDATLMFTNAGMVQFKDVFVGAETRNYKRATTVQKCMRVSGKHNDLEEVGRTARHHTFFEMLGNFSFGDYFKEQAITFAWDLITRELKLDPKRLWITVFGGEKNVPADTEARKLWQNISGLPSERILDMGMHDNFWSMGSTGPCGPCTEIHYDQGEGPVGPEDFESGRVMEIWNNVFMQFDRQADGRLVPLPAPSVDTGMGLERLVALLQNENNNYHSDLFLPLLAHISECAQKPYRRSADDDDVSMRVIADHARATAFLMADGIQPSNEGRGYVLRRIMRRAIRHGQRLGLNDLFFSGVTTQVIHTMQNAYPELAESRSLIAQLTDLEEEGFRRTLGTGLKILEEAIQTAKSTPKAQLPGDVAFRLYDTYGFPKDLTEVIAQENKISIDDAGFETQMAAQKARSRGAQNTTTSDRDLYQEIRRTTGPSSFVGYPAESTPLAERPGVWRNSPPDGKYLDTQAQVVAIVWRGTQHSQIDARMLEDGELCQVILHPTPFYGESGGQVGDTGRLTDLQDTPTGLWAEVEDCQKPLPDLTVQNLKLTRGSLQVGQKLWAGYDVARRIGIRNHHSATHLLHGALRDVLGEHVKQAGSLVTSTHLRFDFTHFAPLSLAQTEAIEADVAQRILEKAPILTAQHSYEEAKKLGAIALFGEKYDDDVRVLTMGRSIELCGGTHASNTAALGMLCIRHEEAVQSGVRRIEAVVEPAAQPWLLHNQHILFQTATALAGQSVDADNPLVLSAQRLRSTYDAQIATLKQHGQTPEICPEPLFVKLSTHLPENDHKPIDLAQAQAARDARNKIAPLLQGKSAEIQAWLAAPSNTAQNPWAPLLMLVAHMQQVQQHNQRKMASLTEQSLAQTAQDLLQHKQRHGNIDLVCADVHVGKDVLRTLVDQLKVALGRGIICLGQHEADKVTLIVAVSADLARTYNAGQLIRQLAPLIGGRGGGKPEFAQAGGNKPDGIAQAFAQLPTLLTQR